MFVCWLERYTLYGTTFIQIAFAGKIYVIIFERFVSFCTMFCCAMANASGFECWMLLHWTKLCGRPSCMVGGRVASTIICGNGWAGVTNEFSYAAPTFHTHTHITLMWQRCSFHIFQFLFYIFGTCARFNSMCSNKRRSSTRARVCSLVLNPCTADSLRFFFAICDVHRLFEWLTSAWRTSMAHKGMK